MAGKFQLRQFAEINLDDRFFDTLKQDYPGNEYSTGFVDWFRKKACEHKTALVFEDDEGVADQDGLMQVIKQIVRLSGVCPILALVCNDIGGMARKMLPFADFCIHCNAENISAGCHALVSADVPSGMEKLRTLVSLLPSNCAEDAPLLDASDDNDRSRNTKTQDFVQMLADTDSLLTLYCDQHAQAAIGRFGGRVAGIVAADDVLPCDAARFVQFCDCYALPVIWITEKCLPHHDQLLYMLARATTVKVLIALNEADSAAALFDVVLSRPESETVGKADDVAAGEELRQLLFNTLELLSVKRDVLPPHKHGNMPL